MAVHPLYLEGSEGSEEALNHKFVVLTTIAVLVASSLKQVKFLEDKQVATIWGLGGSIQVSLELASANSCQRRRRRDCIQTNFGHMNSVV